MAKDFAVRTEGLTELRRGLRRMAPEVNRQLTRELRTAVGIVVAEAAATAPRRTGALARSYRPFVRGTTAGIRSTLPYAGVIEYGGTISPRGTEIRIRRYQPVSRAVERQAGQIVEQFG